MTTPTGSAYTRPLRFSVFIVGMLVLPTAFASRAAADEVGDFEVARSLYERGQYGDAVTRFEAMVGAEVPAIRNEVLVVESRKYLAAAYLFEDRRRDAERQFEWLLRQEPDYALDPVAFPAAVHETFSSVSERIQAEIAERDAARDAAEREARERAMQRILDQQRRIARLEELAQEVQVEQRASRWLAALPFGVGQFQNGHRRLGFALLSVQIFLATTGLATFAYFRYLQGQEGAPGTDGERLADVGRAIAITNQVSSGLLAAVAVGGVIDAQVRFREVRRTTGQRELPEDLRGIPPLQEDDVVAEAPPGPELRLQLGAGYAGLRLQF